MWSGTSLANINSASVSITSADRMLQAALIARHSLVYSSMTVSSRTPLPPLVLICTKSYAHTWSFHSGRRRTQEPSLSHSRPLFGCFAGTFSPSRRHVLSTRLWFTLQRDASEGRGPSGSRTCRTGGPAPRCPRSAPSHSPQVSARSAVWTEDGEALCRHVARRRQEYPPRGRRTGGNGKGLEVSLSIWLSSVRSATALLRRLAWSNPEASVLGAPPVEGLLGHAYPTGGLRDCVALSYRYLRLSQLVDHLLRCMSSPGQSPPLSVI